MLLVFNYNASTLSFLPPFVLQKYSLFEDDKPDWYMVIIQSTVCVLLHENKNTIMFLLKEF